MAAWPMVSLDTIRSLVNARLTRVLDMAQASLPESQFTAFRKLTLNEFGRNGLEGDLQKEFKQGERAMPSRPGSDRNGPE